MKKIIKLILPEKTSYLIRKFIFKRYVTKNNSYEINNLVNIHFYNGLEKSVFNIIKKYHILEKGLTMPNRRLGFGQVVVKDLADSLNDHILNYGDSNEQIVIGIKVLLEYRKVHVDMNFSLEEDVYNKLQEFHIKYSNIICSSQTQMSKNEYFNNVKESFDRFSSSRYSVRYFTGGEVSLETIKKSIALAQNSPSACNRQSIRLKIITDKYKVQSILNIQGGNRGFGHLVDKLIILTTDMNAWSINEYKGGYIDGGIYAMNLLYSLHFYKVAACTLNTYFTPEKDVKMREIINIPYSESFVLIIALGTIPEKIMVANSHRNSLDLVTSVF